MRNSNLYTVIGNRAQKNILFFLVLFLFSSFAQQGVFKEKLNSSYTIQNIESIKNSNAYIEAINTANFNNHRLKSERNILQFEGGIKVILFSAEEVLANGMTNINPNDFPVKIENYIAPLFRLADNNYIIELKQAIPGKF